MVTNSANIRRSKSSIGLPSNITYPIADGLISASNSDGSDFRHIAGIFRRRFPTFTTVIDLSPSIFCFNGYIVQETDITAYITQSVVCTAYITQELDLVGYLKNRC